MVAGAETADDSTSVSTIETTQIAPTILRLVGISPRELQAVQLEGTPSLPVRE